MIEKELINNISRLILDESEDSEEEFGLSDEDSDNCYESKHNSESEQDVISSGSEDEGEEYLGKNGHVWSSKEPIKTRTKSSNIVVRCPGPKASLQIPKASDAFNLYFDDNTINAITKWTNQKIDTVKGNYKFRTFTYEISPDEIRALIGLTLLAGVGKGGSESTKYLFARDGTGRNIFGAGMNERRFVFLLNVLRFDNRESREERRKDDKLAPIRELWELFIAKCSSLYTPGTNCTIDESLLNFRGRCGFKQYIPNKPAKYGIKVFALADSATYYFLTGKIYIGKDSNYDPNFSVPTNVVLELIKPIENTNRNITTDNWPIIWEAYTNIEQPPNMQGCIFGRGIDDDTILVSAKTCLSDISSGWNCEVPNEDPRFLQIYFMDNVEEEIDRRCAFSEATRRAIIAELQTLFHEHNCLVRDFKSAVGNVRAGDMKVIIRADKTPTNEHEQRFNAPMTTEVAAVIVGTEIARRDIVICRRDGTKQSVAETHRSYDALQYPILFPRGEDGYHLELYQVHPISGALTMKKVSCMDFYAYRIMIRAQESNHILKCRQLFQQFIVDMYAKVESERLNYIRFNQSKL
ncbi:hypothetical protein LAZ67_10002320 [Cordylochernes scorpioides]|uniref:Transposase n=1 Tax=Cordylochernes scorpioides TaxID=51811 RepID=A0ABY6KWJ2_9ARAC|nr:hypothetical protein LAZ67_10002320 [Cordylochernes scorpioides]